MMRLRISPALRPATTNIDMILRARPFPAGRTYASTGAETKRRAVTPFNDDGHVPWSDLSGAEKTGRAAQQTFNFGLVLVGVLLTGGVGYVLYTDVFSTDSKTAYFNRAVDRIKSDSRCLELLGDARKITAYGEETNNKWRRARPIASALTRDGRGDEHLKIHFNVQGPRGSGLVNMHLIKRSGASEFEYKYFYIDVRGHQRIYLENADASSIGSPNKSNFKLFGVAWK